MSLDGIFNNRPWKPVGNGHAEQRRDWQFSNRGLEVCQEVVRCRHCGLFVRAGGCCGARRRLPHSLSVGCRHAHRTRCKALHLSVHLSISVCSCSSEMGAASPPPHILSVPTRCAYPECLLRTYPLTLKMMYYSLTVHVFKPIYLICTLYHLLERSIDYVFVKIVWKQMQSFLAILFPKT